MSASALRDIGHVPCCCSHGRTHSAWKKDRQLLGGFAQGSATTRSPAVKSARQIAHESPASRPRAAAWSKSSVGAGFDLEKHGERVSAHQKDLERSTWYTVENI